MELVTESSIIQTFSPRDRDSCENYSEYLDLVKFNPAIGYKSAAKLLGVSAGRTRWWHAKKRSIPDPLKTVQKLKDYGLLPFSLNHPESTAVLNMLGVIFGDGNIDCRLNTMSFISSNLQDIECWKRDLLRIFPFAENKWGVIEGGEYGHSSCIRTFDRSIIRFFVALGAPVGDKVVIPYHLPRCLFSMPLEHKAAFLDGLFSSEISVPQFRNDARWVHTKRFTNFQFGMSKIDSLEQSHRLFLNELQKLATGVGVTFTPNVRKDIQQPSHRKDGHTAYCYRIFLQTHFHKVKRFNQLFPLRYASKKKERLEKEVVMALEHKTALLAKTKPI